MTGVPFEQYKVGRTAKGISRKHQTNPHQLVVGMSGKGKSELLILESLLAVLRWMSVVVIDTHYDTYKKFLKALIAMRVPPSRVYPIDLTSLSLPVPNFWTLAHKQGYGYVAVEGLLTAFRNMPLWRDAVGSRMMDVLRFLFLLLQKTSTPLTMASRVLIDETYRHGLLKRAADEEQWRFWTRLFDGMRRGEAALIVESSRNKLSYIDSNPLVARAFSGTENSFSLKEALDNGKIIAINLNHAYFKDESLALLGSIFLFLIYQAVIEREDAKKRHPVALFLDEFSSYATPPFY